MSLQGSAARAGTERFRQRFTAAHPSHFRLLQDLWASSVGLGTYLGDSNDDTDALYSEAIRAALTHGCNVIDTAINYRCQRSERTIGRTLSALCHEQIIAREEILLCTKGGYLPFDNEVPPDPNRYITETIINSGLAPYDEIVSGCHCLSPSFLDASLSTSLENLRVSTLDVYYLHNPEQQLDDVSPETFQQRLEGAFGLLEQRANEGKLRYYGIATWNGLRCQPSARGALSLESIVALAQRIGGTGHHFKAIQLPYNLAIPEAWSFKNQFVDGESLTVLEAADRLGLSVMISASLLQSRLAHLSETLAARIPGPFTAPQRAIQFVRSTPGVTTALVGMKSSAHVEENLGLIQQPLMSVEDLGGLFDRTRR